MWKKEIHMQQQISDVLHMFYGEFLNLQSDESANQHSDGECVTGSRWVVVFSVFTVVCCRHLH